MSIALKKSPLARVKEEFGGKDKLVDKLVGVLDSGDETKDDVRKRLLGVANRKLIRLYSVASRTKELGGHDKLAATAAERLNRAKDKDYVSKLGEFSNGRLLDLLTSAERRAGINAARTDGAAAAEKKVARAARAAAKPADAKRGEKKAAKPAAKKPAPAKKKAAGKKKR
jgi:hypothetical protein